MNIDPKYSKDMYDMLLHTYNTLSRRVQERDDLELRMLMGLVKNTLDVVGTKSS